MFANPKTFRNHYRVQKETANMANLQTHVPPSLLLFKPRSVEPGFRRATVQMSMCGKTFVKVSGRYNRLQAMIASISGSLEPEGHRRNMICGKHPLFLPKWRFLILEDFREKNPSAWASSQSHLFKFSSLTHLRQIRKHLATRHRICRNSAFQAHVTLA